MVMNIPAGGSSGKDPFWIRIRAVLESDLAAGRYAPGDRLPSEAALAARFAANRHTVRRALAALAEAGLVHARQGAGVYVTARPTDYRISRRTRFARNLTDTGHTPDRQILTLETRAADAREAEALAIAPGAPVHLWEGISLADGAPIALFRSVFCATRFPQLLTVLAETRSVTATLARFGVADYTRKSTRLSAERADPVRARHLRLTEGAPLLRAVSINVDADDRPVEYGRTWFAGDRVQLLVEPD
ncbi:MAG: phosphonate metabolism transcriptional regulator PhnF [Rhodobacteraceae bacterium]|jgi:GntR family phosphonate transport system transcriptional regulator|nr:phosphonate metabolism transcriptional regulator PhnF [Paracoccaceae bacterium]